MKRMLGLGLIFCTLAPATGFAKILDMYDVAVVVQQNAGGRWNGLLRAGVAIGNGLHCSSSLSVSESEKIMDKNGRTNTKNFSYDGNFSFDTLWGQPQSRTQMPVNFANPDPVLDVSISETCSAQVPSWCSRQVSDGRGGTVTQTYRCLKTESLPLRWQCQVPGRDFPNQRGQRLQFECNPPNDLGVWGMYRSNPLFWYMVNSLNRKTISIHMEHLGQEAHFENYNCDMSKVDPMRLTADQRVIRIAGGVKTAAFNSNSIDYGFAINGGSEKFKARKDGVSNFDILYCPAKSGEAIKLTLTPRHKGKEIAGSQTVTIESNQAGQASRLEFQFKGFLGFRTVKSQMEVTLQP